MGPFSPSGSLFVDKPKGILIPIGGSEDKEGRKDILYRVIEETRRKDPLFEIITTATDHSEEVAENYLAAFDALDVRDTGTIHIDSREKADDFLDRIEKCDGVLFSGGNQLKLTTLLGGTRFLQTLKDRYQK